MLVGASTTANNNSRFVSLRSFRRRAGVGM